MIFIKFGSKLTSLHFTSLHFTSLVFLDWKRSCTIYSFPPPPLQFSLLSSVPARSFYRFPAHLQKKRLQCKSVLSQARLKQRFIDNEAALLQLITADWWRVWQADNPSHGDETMEPEGSLHSQQEPVHTLRSYVFFVKPRRWGFIPSTQRHYRRFFTTYYYLNCYMFRSYDHLQVEIYLLGLHLSRTYQHTQTLPSSLSHLQQKVPISFASFQT
jgi:hypothetical protein